MGVREILKSEIRDLDWYDEVRLRAQVSDLIAACARANLSMWMLVEEVGGLFALQILIHAIGQSAKHHPPAGAGRRGTET